MTMNNQLTRKAWVIYFPQFDKYYPYVGRGNNSYTCDLVGAEGAHVFTQLPVVKRVIKKYEGDLSHEGDLSPYGNRIFATDAALGDVERVLHPCIPNAVAKLELWMRNTVDASSPYTQHYYFAYDSSKSVVPDPYNTPLEVQLVEFEISIPVK